jgi:hypothetical protein
MIGIDFHRAFYFAARYSADKTIFWLTLGFVSIFITRLSFEDITTESWANGYDCRESQEVA